MDDLRILMDDADAVRGAAEQGNIDADADAVGGAAEQGNIDADAEQGNIDADAMRVAAEQGNIDTLYALIRSDAKVLDTLDEISFVDTPLHIAASRGHTLFAMEIMGLKSSFAKKRNQNGWNPMHLALQEYHDSKNDALQRNLTQLVDRLLAVDKNLVRVAGRDGVTPFHYAAQTGNLKFLNLCIKICPESLEDVTNRGEDVLHIALKYDRIIAFLFLLQRVGRTWLIEDALKEKLLNWRDEEGNTVLHVAVFKNQLEAVLWLLDRGLVDLKAKNLEGYTVDDILERQTQWDSQQIRLMIRDKLQQRPVRRLTARVVDYLTDERPNALLVVAALLLLMVTFQAALTTPKNGQNLFLLLNALTYCLTTLTLFYLIHPKKFKSKDWIGIVFDVLLLLLFACFCVSTLGITTDHIMVIALSVLFVLTLLALVCYVLWAYFCK